MVTQSISFFDLPAFRDRASSDNLSETVKLAAVGLAVADCGLGTSVHINTQPFVAPHTKRLRR